MTGPAPWPAVGAAAARQIDSAANTISGLDLDGVGEDGHAVANLLWKIARHLRARSGEPPTAEPFLTPDPDAAAAELTRRNVDPGVAALLVATARQAGYASLPAAAVVFNADGYLVAANGGGEDPPGCRDVVLAFTREQVAGWAGRDLTDSQLIRLREALPHSTFPGTVAGVAGGIIGTGLGAGDAEPGLFDVAGAGSDGRHRDGQVKIPPSPSQPDRIAAVVRGWYDAGWAWATVTPAAGDGTPAAGIEPAHNPAGRHWWAGELTGAGTPARLAQLRAGRKYVITHKIGTQQYPRRSLMVFLDAADVPGGSVAYRFSARPAGGTCEFETRHIISWADADPDAACYLNERA